MNPHLRSTWAALATRSGSNRMIHLALPEDPHQAYSLIHTLASGGHTAATAEAGDYDRARLHDVVANEGFSHHPGNGPAPTSGFMAAYHAPEGSPIAQVHHLSEITPEHIAGHRQAAAEHLNKPDSYQGGWLDRGENKVYLDASRHFHDEGEVRDFSHQEKQKAYFDLSDFSEKFMHPKLDPLAMKDHGAWQQRYAKHGTEPAPEYKSYAHLYPPSEEQKKFWGEKGHHLGSKGEYEGRPVGPFRSESWVTEVLRKRHGL